ncbi:MAG TPA: GDSL-type esterase/lipase family protein [Lachnospiraceae bacterium]|nr:GDSL-type esterase/lipase family protein [Lachnospiraceae bacterium]
MDFLATEDKVKVTGRTLYQDSIRYLGYSGSSISFTFTGRKAEALLWSNVDKWEDIHKAWVAVFINDELEPSKRFSLLEQERMYTLYESEIEQTVTIRLLKMSEAAFAVCGVKGLRIDSSNLLPASPSKEKKIEIIGDSITCGYGIEGKFEVDTFTTTQENPWKAYSLSLARALNAEVNLVSWSGIGFISNYVDETIDDPLDDWLMPMLYQYTDAACQKEVFGLEQKDWERWNHERYVPDIIVINIGTNDSSYCRNIESRVEKYGNTYLNFLEYVRKHNPSSKILCILGVMGQDLYNEVERTVNRFKELGNQEVYYLEVPVQLDEDGIGTDWHPNEVTHRKVADLVAKKINSIFN